MKSLFLTCFSFSLFITQYISFTRGQVYDMTGAFGLNYGTQANNLPTPDKALNPLVHYVWRLRIFAPDHAVLDYLNRSYPTQGYTFAVAMGTLDEDVQKIADDQNYANTWVQNNIVPWTNTILTHIVLGNEVIPGPIGNFVVQAMINMEKAIKECTTQNIQVTTAVSMNVLGVSYPPSAGVFTDDAMEVMRGVVNFLQNRPQYKLLVNVYLYFAYANNPAEVRLDYALFNTTDIVVQDGDLQYSNLFYSMVDAMIWAVEKAGGPHVQISVSETGWPSAGNGDIATVEHARMYVNNLIATLLKSGTPKRPQYPMKTYIFAMYNEDLKPEGVERNFGIYQPDLSEVYHVDWPKWNETVNLGNIVD
ncbi:hypothetical protein MKX03_004130 [Papaver bracteatum]|nr:hypothetical protein MKX03_004130 [Papaver bracteatum]